MRDGDSNSKFFHNAVNQRKRRNKIAKLKKVDGTWAESKEDIGVEIVEYFRAIFSSSSIEDPTAPEGIQCSITQDQNEKLTRKVYPAEVKKALFDMHPDKSPGLDGFSPGFYQFFWDIMETDITAVCDDFVQFSLLPVNINKTQLVLIPKKAIPDSMNDLRPISLCNVLYKIVAKVLANRLKPLLNNLISNLQSAFVPGRLITDNVMLAYELQHYM